MPAAGHGERDGKTLTQVILEAVEPVIRPVIQRQSELRERPSGMIGPPRRLTRLKNEIASPVNSGTSFDHLGRWQQKQKPKRIGKLVDR